MKKLFSKNESGRSMVEMLGVLAIIGVLSVGGIAGYKMAMDKNKANEILNVFNTISVDFIGVANTHSCADEVLRRGKIGEFSYSFSWGGCTDEGRPYVAIHITSPYSINSEVCKEILPVMNKSEVKKFYYYIILGNEGDHENTYFMNVSEDNVETFCNQISDVNEISLMTW